MNFQLVNMYRAKLSLMCVLTAVLLISSCTKEPIGAAGGAAEVTIQLAGSQSETFAPIKISSTNVRGLAAETNVQQASVPYDDIFELVATLTPESAGTGLKKLASTTTKTENLPADVLYRVVVYDADEAYVADKVYTAGPGVKEKFALNLGKAYTFVAYSIRSSTIVPAVDPAQSLTQAKLLGLSGNADFMYFVKSNLTLTAEQTTLDVVLKHRFSQVTTLLDATAVGNIGAITTRIEPHRTTADVNLQDGSIIYGAVATNGKPVTFATGSNTATSGAIIICTPEVNTGKFVIAAGGTIGGILRTTALELTGLTIQPGVRYTLELKLKKTEPQGIEGGGFIWAPGNLIYNNGNYGFTANQGLRGDHWQVNALLPYGMTPISAAVTSAGQQNYDPLRDPCAKVTSHGGNWRTPTQAEFAAYTGSAVGQKPVWHRNYNNNTQANYNGVLGVFIGTWTQPAAADLDKYMFLPYAGRNNDGTNTEGNYWTVTPAAANNARFNFNTGNVSWYNSDYFPVGFSIRCVKSN